jgi:hypothetical protein
MQNYSANLRTDPDIGPMVEQGVLAEGVDIGNVSYVLEDSVNPPSWQRFNVGSIKPAHTMNISVSSLGITGGCRLYGLAVEYESSEVTSQ